MIKLKDNEDTEMKEKAQTFLKQLKLIETDIELTKLIKEMKEQGFDLCNKSNNLGSDNFGYMDLGEKRIEFTYGVYPICSGIGTMKYENIYKNFYIEQRR